MFKVTGLYFISIGSPLSWLDFSEKLSIYWCVIVLVCSKAAISFLSSFNLCRGQLETPIEMNSRKINVNRNLSEFIFLLYLKPGSKRLFSCLESITVENAKSSLNTKDSRFLRKECILRVNDLVG